MRSAPAALLMIVWLCACHRQGARTLGTDARQRESYSLGYKLGASLKNQKTSLDEEAYIQGLREALAGGASQVTAEEIRAAVATLRGQALAAQRSETREKADQNRAAGQAFLDGNRGQAGVEVRPSGLQIKRLADGQGRSPKVGDTVVVNYRGTLVDGS